MTQAVVFGAEGENGLWLADLKAGTVTAIKAPLSDELATAASLRASGVTLTKGVNLAIAVSSTSPIATGIHEGQD